MRQDFFEYAPQFKLLVQGNHKPGLRSVDEAMRRRFNLLPFTVTIPEAERDKQLDEKLRPEWPGILQWAIEGCLAWRRGGLNPPDAVRNATAEYFAEEDAIGRWLDERCVWRPDLRGDSVSRLWEDWKKWAEVNREYMVTMKAFSLKLRDKSLEHDNDRSGKFFKGVLLRFEVPGSEILRGL